MVKVYYKLKNKTGRYPMFGLDICIWINPRYPKRALDICFACHLTNWLILFSLSASIGYRYDLHCHSSLLNIKDNANIICKIRLNRRYPTSSQGRQWLLLGSYKTYSLLEPLLIHLLFCIVSIILHKNLLKHLSLNNSSYFLYLLLHNSYFYCLYQRIIRTSSIFIQNIDDKK